MIGMEKRPLGQIETQMTIFHQEFGGTTQGCQLALLTGPVPIGVLREAAGILFSKYEPLRCAIVERDAAWAFVEHGEVTRIAIEYRSAGVAQACEQAFVDELNRALDASFALWRLLVLEEPGSEKTAIIMTCHHAIMDGFGMFSMLEDLLSFADLLLSGATPEYERQGMPAPIDAFLLPPRASKRADAPVPTACEPIPFRRPAPLADRRSHIERITLGREERQRLEDAANRQRIAVNSVLAAAVAKAAHATAIAPSPLALKTAVSLRDRVAGHDDARNILGCYIAVADCSFDVSSRSLPELAAAYETQLLACIFNSCIRRTSSAGVSLTSRLQSLRDSTIFAHGIGITNMGSLPFDARFQHFRLDDLVAASNRNAGNAAFVVGTLDFGDRLSLTITFTEPLMPRTAIRELAGFLQSMLTQYGMPEA